MTHKIVLFNCYDRTSVHHKFETAGEENKSIADLFEKVQEPSHALLLNCLKFSGIRDLQSSIGLLGKLSHSSEEIDRILTASHVFLCLQRSNLRMI